MCTYIHRKIRTTVESTVYWLLFIHCEHILDILCFNRSRIMFHSKFPIVKQVSRSQSFFYNLKYNIFLILFSINKITSISMILVFIPNHIIFYIEYIKLSEIHRNHHISWNGWLSQLLLNIIKLNQSSLHFRQYVVLQALRNRWKFTW